MSETQEHSVDLQRKEIQWTIYAEYYDAMCSVNPAYEAMLDLVEQHIAQLPLPEAYAALDIGAGTGNLLSRLAPKNRHSSFIHLDIDAGMIAKAKMKYRRQNTRNVQIYHSALLDADLAPENFDLIVSTNALYAIQPHEKALEKIYTLLKNDGYLLLVDFGRKQNTNDWLWYIVQNSVRKNGIGSTLRIVRDNWEAARQNKRTTAAQDSGQYWIHDTNEFCSELSLAGFEVLHATTCYRDYSDLAVCRKKTK